MRLRPFGLRPCASCSLRTFFFLPPLASPGFSGGGSSTFFYLLYFFFLPPLASPGFSGGGSHGAAKSRYRISFSSSP